MSKIVRIQWGYLNGRRRRHAGENARLGGHGIEVREPLAIITLDASALHGGFVGRGKVRPRLYMPTIYEF